ncbi:MAG: hypothetical protein KDA42_14810 [Planctomycetales bacterium]|nr:hypothetical protein [Planctomycetales bacterium]
MTSETRRTKQDEPTPQEGRPVAPQTPKEFLDWIDNTIRELKPDRETPIGDSGTCDMTPAAPGISGAPLPPRIRFGLRPPSLAYRRKVEFLDYLDEFASFDLQSEIQERFPLRAKSEVRELIRALKFAADRISPKPPDNDEVSAEYRRGGKPDGEILTAKCAAGLAGVDPSRIGEHVDRIKIQGIRGFIYRWNSLRAYAEGRGINLTECQK